MPRRFDLIPWLAMRGVAFIVAIGLEKHGRDTWRDLPIETHMDCALSHLAHWNTGQKVDPDTGHSHLWNAATRVLFCVELEMRGSNSGEGVSQTR